MFDAPTHTAMERSPTGYDGFRAVKHDLLELKDAATLYIAGERDARQIVLLCAGFPCDHSSFIPLAARLANESGCLVGVSCMPEFDREGPPLRPNGYDLDETARCFAQAVDALRAQSMPFVADLVSSRAPSQPHPGQA